MALASRPVATIQEDIDSIRQAIGSGELEVTYTDRKVRYRSMNELFTALAALEDELASCTGADRPMNVRMVSKDGW